VYEPCQLEFQRWCEAKDFPQETRTTVTPQRLATFLDEEVLNRTQRVRGRKRKHTDASGENTQQPVQTKKIGLSAVRIYVAAVVDLWLISTGSWRKHISITENWPRFASAQRNEAEWEGEKITQFVDKV